MVRAASHWAVAAIALCRAAENARDAVWAMVRGARLSAVNPILNGGAICDGDLAASARSCIVADVSFVETNGATAQLSKQNNYLASLSELEQRVCSIARDHLESSFDLSRSSGFIAWAGKK